MKNQEIKVEDLQKMFENGEKVTVLDVRPIEQRSEWQIADSIHRDVYQGLVSGDTTVFDQDNFDKDIPIVTVCTAGKTSLIASELLKSKGFDALSLHGGMKAWNYAWNTARVEAEGVTLLQVRRVAKGCVSYMVASEGEAIVVDASLDPSVYISLAQKNGWTIKYAMDTHVHADYISRTIDLVQATNAKHLFTQGADVAYSFIPLKDGQEIEFGGAVIQAIHTPGHTPESISYLVGNQFLLTGDTLFTNGVGRPDLKADQEQALQKADELFKSLEKIKQLSSDILVLPAHTSSAIAFDQVLITDTIANLFARIELLQLSREEFIAQTIQRIPATPPNYIEIATLNKSGNYQDIDPADLEAGANRCAVS
ncbi:MBL fold metallo-hydrolase [Myroides odoratimimus]|uniref:MBL fold metallo-hydrolase n=1 Tax=Myroides odoratimimus TaxID=76832 RepID=UPI003101354D